MHLIVTRSDATVRFGISMHKSIGVQGLQKFFPHSVIVELHRHHR
jgi:hypothetical protein